MILKHDYFPNELYNLKYEQLMASLVVLGTWYKIFYWMKLFNTPAFFINLLSKTMDDVNFKAFMIMTILCVLTFTNVFYIMNQERGTAFKYNDSENYFNMPLYSEDAGMSGVSEAFIYMYKLTLGDFGTKSYMGENSWFLWAAFLLATFFLQITFFNMLIAIMGNTFSEVMDSKEESSMKERISILADFRLLLRSLRLDSEFQYLFVLKKDTDSALGNEWNGELQEIRKQFEISKQDINDR